MTADYRCYFEDLLSVIALHQNSERAEMDRIEVCFKASLEVWGRMQKHVKRIGFESVSEEVYFFKHVKPGVTCYIEYFTCRYHALLFRPSEDGMELMRFWRWELRKIEKFFETNREFCAYVRNNQTDKDQVYFLRSGEGPGPVLQGRIHDLDPETATEGDHLMTMMKAYELYEPYIRDEVKKLGGYFSLTK